MLAIFFLKKKTSLSRSFTYYEYDITILGRYLPRHSIKVSDGQGLAMPKLYFYFYIFLYSTFPSIIPTKLNHFSL